MKLLCHTTCFIGAYYNEDQVVNVGDARAKELLASGYFERLNGPPPEKVVERQEPGKRRKITVK